MKAKFAFFILALSIAASIQGASGEDTTASPGASKGFQPAVILPPKDFNKVEKPPVIIGTTSPSIGTTSPTVGSGEELAVDPETGLAVLPLALAAGAGEGGGSGGGAGTGTGSGGTVATDGVSNTAGSTTSSGGSTSETSAFNPLSVFGGTPAAEEAGDGMTERESEDTEGGYQEARAPASDGGSESVGQYQPSSTSGTPLNTSGWYKNRGLVQIPTTAGDLGPCGSYHYNSDSPPPIDGRPSDNYADPKTACTFVAFLQEWKRKNPAEKNQLQWGDISHHTNARFNKHATHTQGQCIDIRPMSTEGGHFGTNYSASGYDREKTRELIRLALSMGAEPVYFNDPEIKVGRSKGHDDHIHICFKPGNPAVESTCQSLKIDPNICGDL